MFGTCSKVSLILIFGVSCKRGTTVYVASPIASAVLMLAFVLCSAD